MFLIVFVLLAKLWQLDEIDLSMAVEHTLFEEIKTTNFFTAERAKLVDIAINY